MNLNSQLGQLENAQLVRKLAEEEMTYIFKHALVQDTAYASLLRHDRKQLHRAVGETLEQAYPHQLDELAALLARHFEFAEQDDKALEYLMRAAEWARRAVAHREQAALLARAIAIAERGGRDQLVADLHAKRGKAFASVTLWQDAKQELETALAAIPSGQTERRAEVLVELAAVTQWLWDTVNARHHAEDALALAEKAGRNDLAASAMSQIAIAEVSEGRTHTSLEYYDRAFARSGDFRTPALLQGIDMSGLVLYWISHYDDAIARIRKAVHFAREANDSATIMRGLSTLGLALMGSGQYGEAINTFEEARQFGRTHQIGAFLARCTAMLGGLHLELFDYSGAEVLAEEARAIGRAAKFSPAIVSAAIDLLLNFARRGQMNRAEHLVHEVEQAIPATYGSHRWLWELRFAQAQAELALARCQWERAFTLANESIAKSRATGRVKYETAGLETRAQSLAGLGRKPEAIADLQSALALAQSVNAPAMFLRPAAALLHLEGNDTLITQARDATRRIKNSLPIGTLRDRFDAFMSELI